MLECDAYTMALALFGSVVLFFFCLDSFWGVLQMSRALLAPFFLPHEETSLVKKYGQWALITGSTDGIGRAYARELAKRGINIVLVSRNEEKLKTTARAIGEVPFVEELFEGKLDHGILGDIIMRTLQISTRSDERLDRYYSSDIISLIEKWSTVIDGNKFCELHPFPGLRPHRSSDRESEFGVKTKIIQADFSTGAQAIETVKKELGDLSVGILVNNVGKNYDYPMYLGEVPESELWDIITINCGATTLLSRLLIEQMKIRGRGAIVNVSSGSELQPLPLMTVYAATKAYIRSFTAALRYEYSKSGVTIQHLAPLFTCTKMNSFSQRLQETNVFVPSAETYAKYAVSTLGKADESTGYWAHGIQYFLTKIPPVWIRTHVGGYLNKTFRKEYFASKQTSTQKSNNNAPINKENL